MTTTASPDHPERSPRPRLWPLVKQTATKWTEDEASVLGAALSYYSIFSLGPIVLVAIAIAGAVFGEEAARGELLSQLHGLLGGTGAKVVEGLIASAHKPGAGLIATIIGVATLLAAAVGVVVQLKDALNKIWDVPREELPTGVRGFVHKYVVSLAAVIAMGILLMVSVIVTTVIAATGKYLAPYLPLPELGLQLATAVASFALVALLFAIMFKFLPDTKVQWRDVAVGAVVTALLFTLGKSVIGLYIGKQSFTSTYGAAGSLIALLVWVYYSAQIVFFGAEFTSVFAHEHGSRSGAAAAAPSKAAPPARRSLPARAATPTTTGAPGRPLPTT
jgi:membrane protein